MTTYVFRIPSESNLSKTLTSMSVGSCLSHLINIPSGSHLEYKVAGMCCCDLCLFETNSQSPDYFPKEESK